MTPVESDINSELGNDIDGKVTKISSYNSFAESMTPEDIVGKNPELFLRKASLEGRPAQVEPLGGNNLSPDMGRKISQLC